MPRLPSLRFGLSAVDRLSLRYIHLGLEGVVHVVGEGGEGDVGDRLHDLLITIVGLPDIIEGFVGGVAVTLGYLPDEPLRICL